jgi:hypothetical protein
MEVVAKSADVAKQVAAEEWDVPVERLAGATATPIRPYKEEPAAAAAQQDNSGNWGIWVPSLNRYADAGGDTRRFSDRAAAQAWVQNYNQRNSGNELVLQPREIEPAEPIPGSTIDLQRQRAATSTAPQQYEIYNRLTNVPVMPLASPDSTTAWRTAQGWARQMLANDPSFVMGDYSVRVRT